jgi:hypothetical protein
VNGPGYRFRRTRTIQFPSISMGADPVTECRRVALWRRPMRVRFVVAFFACVTLTAGCGSSTQTKPLTGTEASASPSAKTITTQAAPPLSSGPQPTTIDQLCTMQPWPHPIPTVAGLYLDDVIAGSLGCWDNIKAIAPDGHDVETSSDDVIEGKTYRIVDVSPRPGTVIGRSDFVNLHVVPFDLFDAPKTQHPCDWVTDDEAAALLGGASATADPSGDETGSVEPFCVYSSGPNSVTSQLYLPESFPVDAQSEFLFRSAVQRTDGAGPAHSTDVEGLPERARCTTAQRDAGPLHTLLVLLGGNRLYVAEALNVSCDTLRQFAEAAIARIGS